MSEAVKIIVGEGESAEINVPGYGVIKGQDGRDGVSPVFTTQPIEGGYRLTITDAAHPQGQSFDVLDGASAYEQAVAGGYTGSEEQFNEELSSFKTLHDETETAATAAAESATSAGQSATAAEGSAESAASSASASATSASDASQSAGSAANSATSAASSAAKAAASAASAGSSASTATEKASEAASSATSASTSAASAQGSASNAASSATAASASATAAGNAQTAAETAASHYPQITNGYWYVWDVSTGAYVNTNVKAEGEDGATGPAPDMSAYRTAAAQDVIDNGKAPIIIDTASGAIASFDDGADNMPLKALTVNVEPVQSGTGDPSTANVRPISGWTRCKVARTGKNLLPVTVEAQTVNNVNYTPNPDSTITVNGTASANSNYYLAGNDTTYVDIGLMPGTYTLSGGTSIAYLYVIAQGKSSFVDTGNGITFTVAEGDLFRIFIRVGNGKTATNLLVKPMIRLASDTDSTFEPFVANDVYHITFPTEAGTVYGGTLTINEDGTGELRKRPYYASYNGETLVGPWLSSMDIYAEGTTPTIGAQVVDLGGDETVYQLTDLQVIDTLLGTNNIWADCGDVEVEYRADTKLFVEQQSGGVTDVQVAGSSIVQVGVANIPIASASTPGVVISGTVTITGTTPTITALPGVRYVCGEVTTLDITLPESGIVDVTFESGSTATVLTITPPSGVTLKWANGFDPTSLDADTTYEINIMDGLGVAIKWI